MLFSGDVLNLGVSDSSYPAKLPSIFERGLSGVPVDVYLFSVSPATRNISA